MLRGFQARVRSSEPEFGEGCIPVHLGALGFETGEADMPSVAFQGSWRSGRGLIVRVRIALSRGTFVQFLSPCELCTSARHPSCQPHGFPRTRRAALLGWASTGKGNRISAFLVTFPFSLSGSGSVGTMFVNHEQHIASVMLMLPYPKYLALPCWERETGLVSPCLASLALLK